MMMVFTATNYFNKTKFDKKRRVLVSRLRGKKVFFRWVLRRIEMNKITKLKDRIHYHILRENIYLLKRNHSVSRIVSRCIVTDTPHSVNKQFRISRMSFKENVAARFLTGVTQLPVRK